MTAEIDPVLLAPDSSSTRDFEVKPQPAPEFNNLDPMPKFSETPFASWAAQPIAPPLPPARVLAPLDFQQQFVDRCLYSGQNVLDEGALAFSAPGIPDGTDLMFKANDAELGGLAFTPLLQPPAPQPDYFGHLLGHPMNPALYEDDSVVSTEEETDELASKENTDDALEPVIANDEVEESPVGKVEQEKPTDPKSAPTTDDESSDDSGDDDFDYFGHIMGHPMNRGNGRKKTPRSRKKKARKAKSEKTEPDEAQVSVLNLFLGGVEVCDRDENISHFTKNEDDSSMEMSKDESSLVAAGDHEAQANGGPPCEEEEQNDQFVFEDSPIKNVSALIEESKDDVPECAPKTSEEERAAPVELNAEPEKTGSKKVKIASPEPQVSKPVVEARPSEPAVKAPEEPKTVAKVVAEPSLKRFDAPTRKLNAEKTKDVVAEENDISDKIRSVPVAPKKTSFFGRLCGSKK